MHSEYTVKLHFAASSNAYSGLLLQGLVLYDVASPGFDKLTLSDPYSQLWY
jgi:hypothetical protein